MKSAHEKYYPISFHGVMISSTFTDLVEHRKVLFDIINSLSLKPIAMEYNPAKPASDVIESSLTMVRDSSAYIGVISRKYGQIPNCDKCNPNKLSLTELEFNEARDLNRPILLFIMGENHQLKESDVELNDEKREKLNNFREEAKKLKKESALHRVYKVFNSLQEFEVSAAESLANLRILLEERDNSSNQFTGLAKPVQEEMKGFTESFDRNPVNNRKLNDLEINTLNTFLNSQLTKDLTKGIVENSENEGINIHYQLEHLGCMIDEKPTNGAFLCFAKKSSFSSDIPACTLQMVNYNSPNRGGDNVSINLISGNLLALYHQGIEWLTSGNVLKRIRLISSNEEDDLEIPNVILREALVNALIHRDYNNTELFEQPTRIEVYSNRVEITSYGELPNGIKIEKLNSPDTSLHPFRRNPIIAKIFQCLNLAELNASGVERISAKAESCNLRKPLFVNDGNTVCVKLFRPSSKLAIFISSLFSDNFTERQSLVKIVSQDTILSKYYEPFLFESLSANIQSPKDIILSEIDRCDLFIQILGNKFGAQTPDGPSWIELEYNHASSLSKPILVFIKDQNELEKTRSNKLEEFITKVRTDVIIGKFGTIDEFERIIRTSLIDYLIENDLMETRATEMETVETTILVDFNKNDLSDTINLFAKTSQRFNKFKKSNPETILQELGLLTKSGYTMASVLLFGKFPQRYYPQAHIKCIVYEDNDPSSQVIGIKDITGNIFDQIDETYKFITTHLNIITDSSSATFTRNESYEIPIYAVREVIMNAISHRDYSSSAAISISIFPDRIEVLNPGKLPTELSIADLKQPHVSIPRNPRIAQVLYLQGLVEMIGMGTFTVFNSFKNSNLPIPLFFQRNKQFGVILYRSKIKSNN
jgi:ATP-dependent DNA helicase RecG